MNTAQIDTETGEIAQPLAIVEQKYEITPTGLEITGQLSYDEWLDCGSRLVGMKNALQWCIGDWLLYGEGKGKWGEMYAQALDPTRLSYDTLKRNTWVAKRFELCRRRHNLSFSHHMEVAAIEDDDEQDRILDLAVEREWGREDLREYLKQFKSGSIAFSSESVEWYTPAEFLEAAREVMGGIDLDPASCEAANRTVRAEHYYTAQDDGYAQQWYGRVWCNPPYGRVENVSNQARWSQRLIDAYRTGEVDQGILLVNAVTDREWFNALWDFPMCFKRGRIKFEKRDANEDDPDSPISGSVFVYFGANTNLFAEVFSKFGAVVTDIYRP